MSNVLEESRKLDDFLRETKEKILLEGQKAYIAINGAGAAALLAFLQAIWSNKEAAGLRYGVLLGILSFAFGVALGTSSYLLRYVAMNRFAFDKESWLFVFTYWILPVGCIIAFLFGLGFPVFAGLRTLSFS